MLYDRLRQDITGQGRAGYDRTGQKRTRQDKTRQDRTGCRWCRSGENRTLQDRTGQNWTEHNRTLLDRKVQDVIRQDKTGTEGEDRTRKDLNRTGHIAVSSSSFSIMSLCVCGDGDRRDVYGCQLSNCPRC